MPFNVILPYRDKKDNILFLKKASRPSFFIWQEKSRGGFSWNTLVQIPFYCPEVPVWIIYMLNEFFPLWKKKEQHNIYCFQISLTSQYPFQNFHEKSLSKICSSLLFLFKQTKKNQDIVPYWTLLKWYQRIMVKCNKCKSFLLWGGQKGLIIFLLVFQMEFGSE